MESKSGVGPGNAGTDVEQAELPSVEKRVAAELIKFLGGAVQPANVGGQMRLLPCQPESNDAASFVEVSGKLVEAVTGANSVDASNGDLPFSTLYRLAGKRLGEELADRSKRPRVLTEILASQIRDNSLACEMLNSSLYSMKHEDIQKSLALGKGPLQNTLALRHRCEKALHSAIETMNAVDEALYPNVKIRQKRSINVRMEESGKQKVPLAGSTVQDEKQHQLQ